MGCCAATAPTNGPVGLPHCCRRPAVEDLQVQAVQELRVALLRTSNDL